MTTITLKVSDELAERLAAYQDRLPEIIESGLREVEAGTRQETEVEHVQLKLQVLEALQSTGIVTLPDKPAGLSTRIRHTPIQAGGKPASEIIIENRRRDL